MQALFDVGTSNLRLYLLEGEKLIYDCKRHYGCRDVSIHSEKNELLEQMKCMLDEASEVSKGKDISRIYACGVVSSPFGIVEVPHMSIPLSGEKLYEGVYAYEENRVLKRTIHIIPGVKTLRRGNSLQAIADIHSIRGEETEAFGLLRELPELRTENFVALFPGSHTHALLIKDAVIADILSMFSGELYCALQSSSVLSDPLCNSNFVPDREHLAFGHSCLREYGFNRAVCIGHAMHILTDENDAQVSSYLEGVVQGGIIDCLLKNLTGKWQGVRKVVIAGSGIMAETYKILLEIASPETETIVYTENNLPLACSGLLQLQSSPTKNKMKLEEGIIH